MVVRHFEVEKSYEAQVCESVCLVLWKTRQDTAKPDKTRVLTSRDPNCFAENMFLGKITT